MKNLTTFFRKKIPVLSVFLIITTIVSSQNITLILPSGTSNSINTTTTESIVFKRGYMKINTNECQNQFYSLSGTNETIIEQLSSIQNSDNESINIYPNPTKGILHIGLNELLIGESITIYSIEGKQVLNKTINSKTMEIDISNQPSGVYIISVNNKISKFTLL